MGVLIGVILFFIAILSLFCMFSFAKPQRKPVERLELWMNAYQDPNLSEEKPERSGIISLLGSQAESLGFGRNYMERTRIELVRAGIPLTGYEFNIGRGFAAIFVSILGSAVFKSLISGMLIFAAVWILTNVYVTSKKNKRLRLFSAQLGDALTLFANSLRAGFSFLQAVSSVAREMPDPVSKEFTKLMKEMSLGLSVEKALSNFLIRVPLDDLELLVIAILIQKEVGGNLAEIIDTIAGTIRERITIQREVKTLTAQGKLSGLVVGLLPLFLGLFMYASNPTYVIVLFTHPIGQVMVALGIMNMLIGMFIISKIVKIEV